MSLSNWFEALASGISGRNTSGRSTTWRRRRLRAPSTSESLEARMMLSANVETSIQVDIQVGNSAANATTGLVTAVETGSSGNMVTSELVGESSSGDVGSPAPDSSCTYDVCVPDVGGGEIMGGDISGELGGVDISGDVGGDVGGDIGGDIGGDVGGDSPHPDPGIDVGGGDIGDVGGDIGGGVGGGEAGTVTIVTTRDEAWEGPYAFASRDKGRFLLSRTETGSSVSVILELTGTASPRDYEISTDRELFPPFDPDGRVTVTFAADSTVLNVYVRAVWDSDYELPETVVAKIVGINGNGVIGAARAGTVTIIDKQVDLDITSVGSDGYLNEDDEDEPGSDILLNNDFDAEQVMTDTEWYSNALYEGKMNGALLANEDDFADLNLTNRFTWPNEIQSPQNVRTFLRFNPLLVRIWSISGGSNGETTATVIDNNADVSSPNTLKVEGIGVGTGTISLNWYSAANPALYNQSDIVTFTVWDIDLDIDSDNNQNLDLPARTGWEEELEANKYGIGKLVYPTPLPTSKSFDAQVFTPFVVDFGPMIPNAGLKLEFPAQQGESGYVRIWTVGSDESSPLNDLPLELGGQLITSGRTYTRDELSAATSGDWTFWIQAEVAQTVHSVKKGAQDNKPDDRVTATVMRERSEGQWAPIDSDEVKYMVAENRDVFYPNLQFNYAGLRTWFRPGVHTGETLRNALASEGAYDAKDLPNFGLEKLSGDQMKTLGMDSIVIDMIEKSQSSESNGMLALVYRDYLSPDGTGYILAFAGTQLDAQDILEDIVQGIGLEGIPWVDDVVQQQYVEAMEIGYRFGEAMRLEQNSQLRPRIVGHSLGGGLASVASIANGTGAIPAETFNAAGVHRNTLYRRTPKGFMTNQERYEGMVLRFYVERVGQGVIKAFYMEYDLLSFMQDNMPALPIIGKVPQAIGQRIQLQGPLDEVLAARAVVLQRALQNVPVQYPYEPWFIYYSRFASWLADVRFELSPLLLRMAAHHSTTYYHYGLMVERFPDSNDREWDIFGFPLP
jgi:hypothetical protein